MVIITLKKGEVIYVGIVLLALILSVWVAGIELFSIGSLDTDITEHEGKIVELDEILSNIKHLENLEAIYGTVGESLDSQREEIKLDRMGAVSITLSQKMQYTIRDQCLTINKISSAYLEYEFNCSKMMAVEVFIDNSEYIKFRESKIKLNEINANLKRELSNIKSEKQGKIGFRNLLYVFVVFLSGFSIAWHWGIEKYYKTKNENIKQT